MAITIDRTARDALYEEVLTASGARAFALQIERARTPPARPRAAEQVR